MTVELSDGSVRQLLFGLKTHLSCKVVQGPTRLVGCANCLRLVLDPSMHLIRCTTGLVWCVSIQTNFGKLGKFFFN
jgi:hypothetical protein